MSLRLIPPVAVPLGVGTLAASVLGPTSTAGETFARELCRRLGMGQAALFGSGRAALAAYLERARREDRDEVLVPAYTCWSVPAAVVSAGLRVTLVDVDPTSLDMIPQDVARALGPSTVAVIGAHLFGASCDVPRLVSLVRDRDPEVAVVEDAAQAWPHPSSPADAVLLSFGRGKPLPLGSGGALMQAEQADPLASCTTRGGRLGALSLAMTSLLGRPSLYRIPESLPFTKIGITRYDPAFERDATFQDWRGRLGAGALAAWPRLRDARTRNAAHLCRRIERLVGVTLPAAAFSSGPIRLPVLVDSRVLRDALLPALRRRGIAASPMYPGTLRDIEPLRPQLTNPEAPMPGARALSERLLTLPVYPGLREVDVDAIGNAFAGSLAEVVS